MCYELLSELSKRSNSTTTWSFRGGHHDVFPCALPDDLEEGVLRSLTLLFARRLILHLSGQLDSTNSTQSDPASSSSSESEGVMEHSEEPRAEEATLNREIK